MNVEVQHVTAAAKKFAGLKGRYGKDCRGRVYFTAPYAVYVHEDLEKHHPVGGAKFLSRAVEATRSLLKSLIGNAVRDGGRTLRQAVQLAMLRLLAEARSKCPLKTGALRASGHAEVVEVSNAL